MSNYFLKYWILFVTVFSDVMSQQSTCEWKDSKSGNSFNFCSLKKDPKYSY